MSFPVIGFEVETPKSEYVCVGLIVGSSEEVHHVVIDDGGVSVDVAEGDVVEEVGDCFAPSFGGDVVAIDSAMLVDVVLLTKNAPVHVKG